VFEFDSEEVRDEFLANFCDGGGEDAIYFGLENQGLNANFGYERALKTWGWDGEGDPTVKVTVE
jgi:hypothetical protein